MNLTKEQIEHFRKEGYVIAENVFTDQDFAPVIAAINEFIDEKARQLYAEGKLTQLNEGESYETRFANLYEQCREVDAGLDIMNWRHPALFDFLRNDNLLTVVESLLGAEIMCNPIQHLRAKTPYRMRGDNPEYFLNVPWHQDAGVTLEEADDSEIITFWIPLVDANAHTGCMEVIPQAFKLGLLEHEAEGGTRIKPHLLPNFEAKLVPCKKGGMVIMNKYTPHRGLPNVSQITRWSIDLRYQRPDEPTGRPFHPAFVARSRENPDRELKDYWKWAQQWETALTQSVGKKIHRV